MLDFLFNSNNRKIKKLQKIVKNINSLEEKFITLTDEELKDYFKSINISNKEEIFAMVKEVIRRTLDISLYDVQLMGGLVLSEGKIAEMKTGEGKTLTAIAPAVYQALRGKVHVITVNDYLANRDAQTTAIVYDFLGLSVGVVTSNTQDKKEQYNKNIIYVTNTELAFDYLRDNLALNLNDQVLENKFDFAIIDEIDSILIDEARSPIIISGQSNRNNSETYKNLNKLVSLMKPGKETKNDKGQVVDYTDGHFLLDLKSKSAHLTDTGVNFIEEKLNIDNMYNEGENAFIVHSITQSIVANYCYKKGVDYIVKDDNVLIIDENTGRISEGRRYGDGLHQAIEVKEGLEPKPENQSIATITYQNLFTKYKMKAGMTGTAKTEALEFFEVYNLDVVNIPTHKPIQRIDHKDVIFFTEEDKIKAVISKIKEIHATKQPILIGTTSVNKSEKLHQLLTQLNIKHEVLNAKNHEREAEIISKAGELSAVTIATNMAGRGVDIKVPEESLAKGGLYILGTERYSSRRVDEQLRGRSGRQGDVGVSQFYLSLEDELLVMFGGDKIKSLVKILKLENSTSLESPMLSKTIENSQKQLEQLHFEYRKTLIKFDNINSEQRNVIYNIRQEILERKFNIDEKTNEYIKDLSNNIFLKALKDARGDMDEEKAIAFEILKREYNIDMSNYLINEDDLHLLILKVLETATTKKLIDASFGENDILNVKYLILLQVIDREWKDHLYHLDILSTGIHLRQYNQKDPVIEYKKESYHMFENLIYKIKKEYIKGLIGVQIL